jgi:hypothetical protein
MAIFYPFSRSPRADSGGLEKRDSVADSAPSACGFLAAVALGSEVLRYFMLHRALIPQRSPNAKPPTAYDAVMRARLEPLGAEFISASDVFCDAQGCLTRIGDAAEDIVVSDQVHLTEKGSVFLIDSIIDRLLGGVAPAGRAR